MKLESMLEKCKREQWRVADLDWDQPPRELSRDDEIAIVQYFTDMAGIERLAGALFAEQQRKVDDPVLQQIFATFVKDEQRHSQVAQMLADYYDVHQYQYYRLSPSLARFTPYFVDLLQYLAPEVANAYITAGELILDIALLRSLTSYVNDTLTGQAMDLINRDESRHIAIDYHMIRYYSSEEYAAKRTHAPRQSPREKLRAWRAMSMVIFYGAPFFKAVFFEPMHRVDPSGDRMREAFKRIQLIGMKPGADQAAILRFFLWLQDVYNDSRVFRSALGPVIERTIGLDREYILRLYSDEELQRVGRMSYDEMAQEALRAKAS